MSAAEQALRELIALDPAQRPLAARWSTHTLQVHFAHPRPAPPGWQQVSPTDVSTALAETVPPDPDAGELPDWTPVAVGAAGETIAVHLAEVGSLGVTGPPVTRSTRLRELARDIAAARQVVVVGVGAELTVDNPRIRYVPTVQLLLPNPPPAPEVLVIDGSLTTAQQSRLTHLVAASTVTVVGPALGEWVIDLQRCRLAPVAWPLAMNG